MPKATRKTDLDTGHGSKPPTAAIEGSEDVLVNGLNALRRGDALASHGCNVPARRVSEGSPSVFINGRPAARIGDSINCGGTLATASDNVFVDENEGRTGAVFAAAPCIRECMQSARRRSQAFVEKS